MSLVSVSFGVYRMLHTSDRLAPVSIMKSTRAWSRIPWNVLSLASESMSVLSCSFERIGVGVSTSTGGSMSAIGLRSIAYARSTSQVKNVTRLRYLVCTVPGFRPASVRLARYPSMWVRLMWAMSSERCRFSRYALS